MSNLVANPGFETGTFTGWTERAIQITDQAHSGSHAARAISADSLPVLSQAIRMDPIQNRYQMGFWVRSETAQLVGIALEADQVYELTVRTPASGAWSYYQTEFTSTFKGTAELQLFSYGSSSVIFDDIHLTPIIVSVIKNERFLGDLSPWVATGKATIAQVPGGGVKISGDRSLNGDNIILRQSFETTENVLYETLITISGTTTFATPTVNLSIYQDGPASYAYSRTITANSSIAQYALRFFGQGAMIYQLICNPVGGTITIDNVRVEAIDSIQDSTVPSTLNTVVDSLFPTLNNWIPPRSNLNSKVSLISSQPHNYVLLKPGGIIGQVTVAVPRRMIVLAISAYALGNNSILRINLNGQVRRVDGVQVIAEEPSIYYFSFVTPYNTASITLESIGTTDLAITQVVGKILFDAIETPITAPCRIYFEATTVPVFGYANPGQIYFYDNGQLLAGSNPISIQNFAVSETETNYRPFSFLVGASPTGHKIQLMINESQVLYRDFAVSPLILD